MTLLLDLGACYEGFILWKFTQLYNEDLYIFVCHTSEKRLTYYVESTLMETKGVLEREFGQSGRSPWRKRNLAESYRVRRSLLREGQ